MSDQLFDMLDMRVDLKYDVDRCEYGCVCSLWDGDEPVCSKNWWDKDASVVVHMVIPFWLYWSALYYDHPDRTPEKTNKRGWKQLQLGI